MASRGNASGGKGLGVTTGSLRQPARRQDEITLKRAAHGDHPYVLNRRDKRALAAQARKEKGRTDGQS